MEATSTMSLRGVCPVNYVFARKKAHADEQYNILRFVYAGCMIQESGDPNETNYDNVSMSRDFHDNDSLTGWQPNMNCSEKFLADPLRFRHCQRLYHPIIINPADVRLNRAL